ncbi:hypothetical protein [Variovorax sp. E3]|jgi:hypothetical protein|uniref:hypothetical protein n=1 Tax=Variovorax sp. E3 TaxID=1914993 RepID=UPI0018DBD27A|nr:hypothetical protein [Variovorax sp. E3]
MPKRARSPGLGKLRSPADLAVPASGFADPIGDSHGQALTLWVDPTLLVNGIREMQARPQSEDVDFDRDPDLIKIRWGRIETSGTATDTL